MWWIASPVVACVAKAVYLSKQGENLAVDQVNQFEWGERSVCWNAGKPIVFFHGWVESKQDR